MIRTPNSRCIPEGNEVFLTSLNLVPKKADVARVPTAIKESLSKPFTVENLGMFYAAIDDAQSLE